jgi:DNA-binding response OmpR family regulator
VTPPGAIYLLRKGTRRPNFRIDGPVVKKPLQMELLGQTVRERFGPPGSQAAASKLRLDRAANTLSSPTGEARLTNIEANLLAYLMDHGGEILHPRELLVDVWEYSDAAGASTLVRAHVSNLRRKLRSVAGPMEHIQTIRGKGYRFIA